MIKFKNNNFIIKLKKLISKDPNKLKKFFIKKMDQNFQEILKKLVKINR